MTIRLRSLVLPAVLAAVGMVVLSRSITAAELPLRKVTDDFFCEKMAAATAPYACSLRANKAYLGVKLGMEYKQAFLALKDNASHSVWVSYESSSHPRKSNGPKAGIDDNDWAIFQRTDRWILRDKGYPCTNYRYIFLRVADKHTVNLDVHCDELVGHPQGIYQPK